MKHVAPSEFRPQPIGASESVIGFCIALPFMFVCVSYLVHGALTGLFYSIGLVFRLFS